MEPRADTPTKKDLSFSPRAPHGEVFKIPTVLPKSSSTISEASEEESEHIVKSSTKCNCKNSQCLKLYCPCFAANSLCSEGCNCIQCENTHDSEIRKRSRKRVREKTPSAFHSRIIITASDTSIDIVKTHKTGCNCLKSRCLKKYCECFRMGVQCGSSCRCLNCLNTSATESFLRDLI